MEESPYVIARNLTKVYSGNALDGTGEVRALDDVSLDIPAGQLVAVMGPSGSGKSTLLHIIGGLMAASQGSISIGGTSLTGMSDRELTLFRRRNIGVVFQSFNLIPTLTAEENAMLPILAGHRAHSISRARLEEAIGQLFERLGISLRRRHYPDALSGGEQQRVAIARALLMDFVTDSHDSLLLADEPTGNLDSANGELICRLLRELCNERHHTMLVVTHEPAVANWSDRIIRLKDGRLVDDSAPKSMR